MRQNRRTAGKPALEVLEEAISTLRRCGSLTLLCYFLGTIPFVLGFLYFWAEMSAGAYAERNLAPLSLALAGLFVWMKCWQSVFAVRLLAFIGEDDPPVWSAGRVWRLAVQQTAVQSTGLFLMPVALLLTIPAAWTYAFYQSFLVNGSGEKEPTRVLAGRSMGHANCWVRQNHLGIAYLSVFGAIVFVNFMTAIFLAPWLLKTMLEIETLFSRSSFHLFNTTVLTVAAGLTHLTVDPIAKTFYILREFYGRSIQSGDDLKVTLRRLRPAAVAVLTILLLPVSANARPQSIPSPAVQASELDRSIDTVLARPEYAWRAPRVPEPATAEKPGVVDTFFKTVREMVWSWLKPVRKWLRQFADWLDRYLREHGNFNPNADGWIGKWTGVLKILLYGFCALVIGVAAYVSWQAWKQSRAAPVVTAQAVRASPDLRREEISADELPEDRWLELAEEMAARGEFRLSLRALYLAALAHLGMRELITITRAKSNKEFQAELARRARTHTELLAAFGESVHDFERAWYGRGDVTRETVTGYTSTVRQIRQC